MPRDVDDRTLPADPTADMHAVTKQYCDANRAAYIEWAGSPVTDGIDKDAVHIVAFCAVTSRVTISRPLKVTSFSIDMNGAGTFDLLLTHGPFSWADSDDREAYMICADEVIASTGPHTFVPDDGDLVLSPGVYHVTCRHSDGVSTHYWNHTNINDRACSLFRIEELWGDGTLQTSAGGEVLNLKMTAYPGTWRV